LEYREVRVYDGDFPSIEQVVTGDPNRPIFPKEAWLQQVALGDIAVRYRDFKTGLARSPSGKHVRSSEICRIFANREDANANSRTIVDEHPAVICVLYDHTGVQVGRVSNRKVLGKFAAAMYAGIVFWGFIYAVAGMTVLWLVYWVGLSAVRLWWPAINPIGSLRWFGWLVFAVAGLLTSIAVWLARLRWVATKRVQKTRSSFTSEEWKRFAEINQLHVTTDTEKRERLLKLYKEFQERLQESVKKRDS
jgi:hypothetical protein